MYAGSNYMLPPCSLPNRCSPTCACGGYGSASGGPRKITTGQKVFLIAASLFFGTLSAGAYYADYALKQRLAAQEAMQRAAAQRYVRNR
jgi:hypothetical protein